MTTPYERGQKDGMNHCLKVMGGEQGRYPDNEYPSNPFHKANEGWHEYNAGFKAGYQQPFNLGVP